MIYNEILKLNEKELKALDEEIINLLKSHFSQINDDLTNFLTKNSKRLRANLIFLFSKALNINIDSNIIKLATAIELLHSATLIHDDIIDEATIRRGFETFNVKYTPKIAVITGDFVLTLVIDELISLKNTEILSVFSSSISKLCLGELKQNCSANTVPTIEEYIKKSEDKTSSLFEAGLKSLSIITNLRNCENNLNSFAIYFGIAFQIKDDLKNIMNKDCLKLSSSDFNCGIYTAPVIFYESKFNNIANFQSDWSKNTELKSEIITSTKSLIKKYSDMALDSISYIGDNQAKTFIEQLCTQLWELD